MAKRGRKSNKIKALEKMQLEGIDTTQYEDMEWKDLEKLIKSNEVQHDTYIPDEYDDALKEQLEILAEKKGWDLPDVRVAKSYFADVFEGRVKGMTKISARSISVRGCATSEEAYTMLIAALEKVKKL